MKEKIKILDKNDEKLKLKKITKKQKLQDRGITLIALVVTIVILLILAGVTLNIALSNNGLFSKAKKATEEYEQAQSEEEDLILKYEYEMAQLQGEISETETFGEYVMEKEIKEKYGQDIKIGDTVNYEDNVEGYDGTWKVLGIENGQLLLMSSKPIINYFELKGVDGYVNGVKRLDDLCSKFGSGDGALDARSLRVEDINRITRYDPYGNDRYFKNELAEFGINVSFRNSDDGRIIVIGSNGKTMFLDSISSTFVDGSGDVVDFNVNLEMVNTIYEYVPSTGKTWVAGDELPLVDDSAFWKGLFDDYKNESWLGDAVCEFIGSRSCL